MLSLELIAILGLLYGAVVYVMVVTQLERRSVRIAEKETDKGAQPGGESIKVKQ